MRYTCQTCHSAGYLYCKNCSRHWLLLPSGFDYLEPERCCWPCVTKHSSINFQTKWDISGKLDGPTLLLLHPEMSSRKFFHLQVEHWEKWARVICLDLPGHGAARDDPLTMATALLAVGNCVSEVIPTGNFSILGWSLGGYVGLMYAALNSERVENLVLGGCGAQQFGGKTQLQSGMLQTLCRLLPDKYLWSLLPSTFPRIPRGAFNEAFFRPGWNAEVVGAALGTMRESQPNVYANALAGFGGKVFFIFGEKENRSAESLFLEVSPRAHLHLLKGASHLAPLELDSSEEFTEIVTRFLAPS